MLLGACVKPRLTFVERCHSSLTVRTPMGVPVLHSQETSWEELQGGGVTVCLRVCAPQQSLLTHNLIIVFSPGYSSRTPVPLLDFFFNLKDYLTASTLVLAGLFGGKARAHTRFLARLKCSVPARPSSRPPERRVSSQRSARAPRLAPRRAG